SNEPSSEPSTEPVVEIPADAIAIIGLGCRFPGADTPRAYWDLLERGGTALSDVPEGRWPARYNLDALLRWPTGERLEPRAGFFRQDVYAFDAATFRTLPGEARFVDPQQRLFAEVAWEALEDSGYGGNALSGVTVGVYVGASSGHYHEDIGRLFESGVKID